ncbi:MAG: hypothetical protein ACYTJ0_05305 [Planctomycetota bacterium]|jgi:hypothetical protein
MNVSSLIGRGYGGAAGFGFPLAVVIALMGAGRQDDPGREPWALEEISVQRINVVEPDGSLKMVISSAARMHPGRIGGKDLPPRSRPPGIIFFDEQGDEAGGILITGDGESRFGGFLVDQIGSDESVRLVSQQAYTDDGFLHRAGLSVTDRSPDIPLLELLDLIEEIRAIEDPQEQEARMQELRDQGALARNRLFVGRDADGGVLVDLRDTTGRSRLRLAVSAEGEPRIEFLDESGAVTRTVTGAPDDAPGE